MDKWINGLSIPSPEKITTLASWLNVSEQWLRYGLSEDKLESSLATLDHEIIDKFI